MTATTTRPTIAELRASGLTVADIRADGVVVLRRPDLAIGELPFALYVVQAHNAVRRRVLAPSPELERLAGQAERELRGRLYGDVTGQDRVDAVAEWVRRFAAIGVRLPATCLPATRWCEDIGLIAKDARQWAEALGRELKVA